MNKLTVKLVALLSIDFRSNIVVCGDSGKIKALIFLIITLKHLKIKKIDKVYLDTCKHQQPQRTDSGRQSDTISHDYSTWHHDINPYFNVAHVSDLASLNNITATCSLLVDLHHNSKYLPFLTVAVSVCVHIPLKPGFHYPSWRVSGFYYPPTLTGARFH